MAWKPFRNLGLKGAALVLGTVLWFTVSGHQIERRMSVPVAFSNVPEGFTVTEIDYENVTVSVRGDDNRVSTIVPGDLRVLLSLEDGEPGTNQIVLNPEDVMAPLGVQVLQIDPSFVTATLEKTVRRAVRVRPIIEGDPIGGLTLGPVSVKPDVITVEGPVSHLDNRVTAATRRVVVTGHGGTFSEDVEVVVADGELRIIGPRTVRVTVPILAAASGRSSPSSGTAAPEGR